MGPANQPDYINAVILVQVSLEPLLLLDCLQTIEIQCGRLDKRRHWGEREIDLDMITYNNRIICHERLTVPHPGAYRRCFVLAPLVEIDPGLEIPRLWKRGRFIKRLRYWYSGKSSNVECDSMNVLPRYIAIEGPIGVGKTSLAEKLAHDLSAYALFEKVDTNPFLEKFYSDPDKFALPAQLFFLITRVQQVRMFRQGDIFKSVRISDFLIDKDKLFAELTLDRHQFTLYDEVYKTMVKGLLKPDLVIYLQAPVEILMRRIEKRGRHFERLIETEYLEQVNTMYTDFFYHYRDAPLLIVNAGAADFIDSDSDYQQLFDAIHNVKLGKYFLNPMVYSME